MKKPKIIISSLDAERLDTILDSLIYNTFPGQKYLEEELDRAKIVAPQEVPPTVVTMNSTVKFIVESSQEKFCLTLVYPKDVDDKADTISILAPVGSALLGLSLGDHIQWPKPGGGMLNLRIEDILYQPERNGDYHK